MTSNLSEFIYASDDTVSLQIIIDAKLIVVLNVKIIEWRFLKKLIFFLNMQKTMNWKINVTMEYTIIALTIAIWKLKHQVGRFLNNQMSKLSTHIFLPTYTHRKQFVTPVAQYSSINVASRLSSIFRRSVDY